MITKDEFIFIRAFFDDMTPFTSRDHQIKNIVKYLIEEHEGLLKRHDKLKKKYKEITRNPNER